MRPPNAGEGHFGSSSAPATSRAEVGPWLGSSNPCFSSSWRARHPARLYSSARCRRCFGYSSGLVQISACQGEASLSLSMRWHVLGISGLPNLSIELRIHLPGVGLSVWQRLPVSRRLIAPLSSLPSLGHQPDRQVMDAGGRGNGWNNLCSGYLTIKRGKPLQKPVGKHSAGYLRPRSRTLWSILAQTWLHARPRNTKTRHPAPPVTGDTRRLPSDRKDQQPS